MCGHVGITLRHFSQVLSKRPCPELLFILLRPTLLPRGRLKDHASGSCALGLQPGEACQRGPLAGDGKWGGGREWSGYFPSPWELPQAGCVSQMKDNVPSCQGGPLRVFLASALSPHR